MTPTIGALFTGYDGIGLALDQLMPTRRAWFSEIDKGATKILQHHWPDTPNLGDITKVDWTHVEPVDILTGGYPCQPFSHAGQRKGTADDRHLWPHFADAIRVLRSRLVILENVAGHLSMGFGDVLGDLAALGFDAEWCSIRASDVGAPHGRLRVFVAAYPRGEHSLQRWLTTSSETQSGRTLSQPAGRGRVGTLLPTPRATDGTKGGPGQRGSSGDLMLPSAVTLLPTPTSRDWKDGSPNSNVPVNALLGRTVWQLLPTPQASDGDGGRKRSPEALADGNRQVNLTDVPRLDWGNYTAAIQRWEALTRPAPQPTQPSRKGTPQLAPAFSEWMMGLPAGHVTAVPGITRNEALRAIGNGISPQQCAVALNTMLATIEAAA
jgi:DNA (cytosine-5)-methyltransferase 1